MAEAPGSSLEKSRQRIIQKYFIVVALLITATTTGMFAWPRFAAGIIEDPLEGTLQSLYGPNRGSQEMLSLLLATKEKVTHIHATSKTWSDIGFLRLQEAMQSGPLTSKGKAALDESITAHRTALILDPYDAYSWTRLAQGLLVRNGATADRLGSILTASLKFSPYDPHLVIARVDVALAVWNQLSETERALMNTQIQLAANQSPTALVRITRERFSLSRVVDSLADTPRLLKRFIYAYTR